MSRKAHVGTITATAKPKRGMPVPPGRIHKNRKRATALARKGRYRFDGKLASQE